MNQAIQWSNNDILINNTVRIVEPYHVENVSIDSLNCPKMKTSPKSDNDTKTHLIKLVFICLTMIFMTNLCLGGQILV